MRWFRKIRGVSLAGSNLLFNTLRQIGRGCVWKMRVKMSGTVLAFRPKDRICQDAEPIALIYRSMGTKAAEEVVNRALAELAVTMAGFLPPISPMHGRGYLPVAKVL